MAAFEAVERLQKFDWLIQKLHSLRSSFNSEQGLQELQKLHALQLLHRNGIQFNEQLGETEEDRIIEEKISGEEEDPEDEEDLEDIEEDTEVLDDEYEDNEDQSPPPKPETALPPSITSGGPPAAQLIFGPPEAHKNGISIPEPEFSKQECDNTSDQTQQTPTGQKYSRFSTGLFPPLPFDPAFLGEESQLKVGQFLENIYLSFVGFYYVQNPGKTELNCPYLARQPSNILASKWRPADSGQLSRQERKIVCCHLVVEEV